jgi:hypothetical protein
MGSHREAMNCTRQTGDTIETRLIVTTAESRKAIALIASKTSVAAAMLAAA